MMKEHSIYRMQILPWLVIDFRLFLNVDNIILEFPETMIKDRPLFVSALLGSEETPSRRTVDFWDTASPFLDWDKIQHITQAVLELVPNRIQCDIDAYFDFKTYPEYQWLNEISKTIKLKNPNAPD